MRKGRGDQETECRICVRMRYRILLFCGCFCWATDAIARPVVDRERIVVLNHRTDDDPLEDSFLVALRSHLSELKVLLDVRPLPNTQNPVEVASLLMATRPPDEPLLYAWLTRYPPRTIVYIFEPKGPHLRARETTVSDSAATASEELALILRSAILAKLSGDEPEFTDEPLPALTLNTHGSAPPTPPTSTSKAHLGPSTALSASPRSRTPVQIPATAAPLFTVGGIIGYVVDPAIANAGFQGGPGIRLFGQWQDLRLGLGYVAQPTTRLRSDDVDFVIERHPFLSFASYRWFGNAVSWHGELHFLADPMLRRTISARYPLEGQTPSQRWEWSLGAQLRGELQLPFGPKLTLAAGGAFSLNPYSFELARAEARQKTAEALAVRPVADLGLVWLMR